MPRKPRKRIKHLNSSLTLDQLGHLISGFCLDGARPVLGGIDGHGFSMPFRDNAHRLQEWRKHKKYIWSLEGKLAPARYFWSENNSAGQRVYFRKGSKPSASVDYD